MKKGPRERGPLIEQQDGGYGFAGSSFSFDSRYP